MSKPRSFSKTIFWWISYIVSIIAFSVLMGYLIAECPCNKNMGTGLLFAIFCYTGIVISTIFHYYKIVQIHIGYSILWTIIVSIAASIIIVWIESGVTYYNTPLQNYFLQWVITGTGFGAIHGIAMVVMVMLKEAKKIPK